MDIKKQEVDKEGRRIISADRPFSLKRFFLNWEWLLILLLIAVNVFNASSSPNYLNLRTLLNATRDFLDKAIIVFPMAFVLMLGEIDISVGSIMALSATLMGVALKVGLPMWAAIFKLKITSVITD